MQFYDFYNKWTGLGQNAGVNTEFFHDNILYMLMDYDPGKDLTRQFNLVIDNAADPKTLLLANKQFSSQFRQDFDCTPADDCIIPSLVDIVLVQTEMNLVQQNPQIEDLGFTLHEDYQWAQAHAAYVEGNTAYKIRPKAPFANGKLTPKLAQLKLDLLNLYIRDEQGARGRSPRNIAYLIHAMSYVIRLKYRMGTLEESDTQAYLSYVQHGAKLAKKRGADIGDPKPIALSIGTLLKHNGFQKQGQRIIEYANRLVCKGSESEKQRERKAIRKGLRERKYKKD
ncbi:MAG: hypothetical protein KJ601_07730 [Nanoarchaeota archaeon]|nr:hypothetical protein [Nanoarchaeota archaeon]MBU1704204.1 hypothetical protein [Nanoarchaeota archaeon]